MIAPKVLNGLPSILCNSSLNLANFTLNHIWYHIDKIWDEPNKITCCRPACWCQSRVPSQRRPSTWRPHLQLHEQQTPNSECKIQLNQTKKVTKKVTFSCPKKENVAPAGIIKKNFSFGSFPLTKGKPTLCETHQYQQVQGNVGLILMRPFPKLTTANLVK